MGMSIYIFPVNKLRYPRDREMMSFVHIMNLIIKRLVLFSSAANECQYAYYLSGFAGAEKFISLQESAHTKSHQQL
jgi:hypothetical protein